MTQREARGWSRRLVVLGMLGSGLAAAACGPSCSCEDRRPEAEPVTIYIVRHAEKDPNVGSDPPLSPAGKLRALALPEALPLAELDAIYVTRTARSEATASAVVAVTGKQPIHYPPLAVAELSDRLRPRYGEHVLVVAHSNTIPKLLEGLGVARPESIPEDQYGDLWVVELRPQAEPTVERRRFGDQPPRQPGPTR